MSRKDRCAKTTRRVARGFALVLVAGAVFSALTGNGLARMAGAVAGYAEFGYDMPVDCGTDPGVARAINGDKIRVCQDVYDTTYGFFEGQETGGMENAYIDMHVALPDQKIEYSCCGSGTDPTLGSWTKFGAATFSPIVTTPSLQGTMTAQGGSAVLLTQTARLITGSDSYTITYTIKNLTSNTLRVRPAVTMSGYGWEEPVWSGNPATATITLGQPVTGGTISMSDPILEVTSYSAGSLDRINTALTPLGTALDNTVHNEDDDAGRRSAAAFAWSIGNPLAAGATRNVNLVVTLKPARGIVVKATAEPKAATPTPLEVTVTDERPKTGGKLLWSLADGTAPAVTGTVTLDAAGHGTFSVPAVVGSGYLSAYFDADANGRKDRGEPRAFGVIYAPPAQQPPVQTPTVTAVPTQQAVAPTPTPTPAKAAPTAIPTVDVKLAFKKVYKVKGCKAKVTLQLKLGKKVIAKRTVKLNKKCQINATFSVPRASLGAAKKVTVVVVYKKKSKSFSLAVPKA